MKCPPFWMCLDVKDSADLQVHFCAKCVAVEKLGRKD